MTSGFALRKAALEDAADIARLVHGLAVYERLAEEAVATEEDFRTHLVGPTPDAHCMMADVADRAVGLSIWFYSFNTFTCCQGLYVEDVFVEPEHRGIGIGRALFRAMAREAVRQGCSRMEWSVLDWNTPSIDFYRSMGAFAMDGWTVQRLDAGRLAVLAQEV